MATGRATTNRRATPRGRHGDVTGNQAIALGKEHAAEVRAAQERMGMVRGAGEPEPYDISDEAEAQREELAAQAHAADVVDHSGSGLAIKALPRPKVRKRGGLRSVSKSGEYDPDAMVTVRFNDDYPGVTLGKHPETGVMRTFDFTCDRPWDVPQWVADHFAEKEMLSA